MCACLKPSFIVNAERQPVWKSKGVGRKEEEEGRRIVFLRLPFMRAGAIKRVDQYILVEHNIT